MLSLFLVAAFSIDRCSTASFDVGRLRILRASNIISLSSLRKTFDSGNSFFSDIFTIR